MSKKKTDGRGDESASLHGLDPEEALRALLAVNPEDPLVEDQDQDQDQDQDDDPHA